MEHEFESLVAHLQVVGEVSEDDAGRIAAELYRDGIVTLAEADRLFDLNERVAGSHPEWDRLFLMAIKDFVLSHHGAFGAVSDEEADWLMSRTRSDGAAMRPNELDLLIAIAGQANAAPEAFGRFIVTAACEAVSACGKAVKADIDRVRAALYAGAGDASIWVSGFEAEALFRTNDAIAFARNDPSWNELFARAIANHLLARAHPHAQDEAALLAREKWLEDTDVSVTKVFAGMMASVADGSWFEKVTFDPGKAEAARQAMQQAAGRSAGAEVADDQSWLMKRLGWDRKVSPAERALIDFLKSEAPGLVEGLAVAA